MIHLKHILSISRSYFHKYGKNVDAWQLKRQLHIPGLYRLPVQATCTQEGLLPFQGYPREPHQCRWWHPWPFPDGHLPSCSTSSSDGEIRSLWDLHLKVMILTVFLLQIPLHPWNFQRLLLLRSLVSSVSVSMKIRNDHRHQQCQDGILKCLNFFLCGSSFAWLKSLFFYIRSGQPHITPDRWKFPEGNLP